MWGYAKKMMLLFLILSGCLLLFLLAYAWPNIGKGPSKEQQFLRGAEASVIEVVVRNTTL